MAQNTAGKLIIGAILVSALAAGIGLYYAQVYAYYTPVDANSPAAEVRMTTYVGTTEDILAENYEGITSDSSPIRYRSCFSTPLSLAMMTETFELYEEAAPLVAPNWFDCFDATQIGEDIQTGMAIAFLGEENVIYGVDRVVAIYPDGRAFAWHQINACGAVVFDGDPAPETCPDPAESQN